MKFKVFGTEVYISFLFAAVLTVMLATDRTGLLLPALFAVFMHELGHLFAMWVLECSPKQIRLIPASVQIVRKMEVRQRNEIIIALCGPLVNIILFASLYINFLCFKNEMCLYYAVLNLIIGLFNLLPVSGLDGGTILFNIISRKKEMRTAQIVVRIITFIVALTAITLAVMLTVRGKINLSLYIMGIYFTIMALIKI